MHARNPYHNPPDFQALAVAYPALSTFLRGRTIDFQDEAAQRCLTQALLKRDFNVDLDLPPDRLCPPVPNRLNYVLWIQDIVSALKVAVLEKEKDSAEGQNVDVCGLDIGTGSSAIYPLLATSLEKDWRFVATELDPRSYEHAKENVQKNGLAERIAVIPAEPLPHTPTADVHFGFDKLFHAVPHSSTPSKSTDIPEPAAEPFCAGKQALNDNALPGTALPGTNPGRGKHVEIQFTMCNPPFYSSAEDVAESSGAKEQGAYGVCTGAPVEMITAGGESQFVGAMVRESFRLFESKQTNEDKDNSTERPHKRRKTSASDTKQFDHQETGSNERETVRWYTSMLGKMSSVGDIVAELRRLKVTNYAMTEFVQGQTRRWAVGWSFNDYRLPDELCRLSKPNPTLQPLLPPHNTLRFTLPASPSSPSQDEPDDWLDRVEATLAQNNDLSVSRSPIQQPWAAAPPEEQQQPVSSTTLFIQATGDCWSRSARRRLKRDAVGEGHSSQGNNIALMCSMTIDGRDLVSRWLYGDDRGLLESFVSHVTRRTAGGVKE